MGDAQHPVTPGLSSFLRRTVNVLAESRRGVTQASETILETRKLDLFWCIFSLLVASHTFEKRKKTCCFAYVICAVEEALTQSSVCFCRSAAASS